VAETASQLGLTVAAVRNRSLRALRSLRGLLGEDALSGRTYGSGS
jgi:DNA-directed RNA polymerase specialized sigma24 family protein